MWDFFSLCGLESLCPTCFHYLLIVARFLSYLWDSLRYTYILTYTNEYIHARHYKSEQVGKSHPIISYEETRKM
jgi:hypothetical protein